MFVHFFYTSVSCARLSQLAERILAWPVLFRSLLFRAFVDIGKRHPARRKPHLGDVHSVLLARRTGSKVAYRRGYSDIVSVRTGNVAQAKNSCPGEMGDLDYDFDCLLEVPTGKSSRRSKEDFYSSDDGLGVG
eukprot:3960403-Pyramimonas_sp.AAC.1